MHDKLSALIAAHEQREARTQTKTAERRLVRAQLAAQRVALKEAEGEEVSKIKFKGVLASLFM